MQVKYEFYNPVVGQNQHKILDQLKLKQGK